MTAAATLPAKTYGPDAVQVPLEKLHESPFNKRRTWGNLQELAESFRDVGILEDLLGRPHQTLPGHIELVFGHRRLRAAKLSELTSAPVKVRELDDGQVVEIQAIENLQRTDIHPIEEAETFELLRDKQLLSAEDLAAKVGKSKAYVYARLKLLDLCPEARRAFVSGEIGASVALYVARVPAKLQPEVLGEFRNEFGDPDPGEAEPVPARDAFRIIQDRYMLRLDQAPFDRGDKTLVPHAGACKDCPKRTGNQKELFADVKSKDVCTDPECFAEKKVAHGARILELARKAGRQVLEGSDARNALAYRSSFVKLDAKTWRQAKGDEGEGPEASYREIAKGAKGLEIVVVQDEGGVVHELARKDQLLPIVQKAGYESYDLGARSSGGEGHVAASAGDQERRAAAEAKRAATLAIAGAVVAAAERKVPGASVWPFLAKLLIDLVGHDAGLEILKRRGVDTKRTAGTYSDGVEKKLDKLLEGMKDEQARGLVVELAASRGTYQFGPWGGTGVSPALKAAAKFYGVNAAKIGNAARAELKARKKAKKTPAKKNTKGSRR